MPVVTFSGDVAEDMKILSSLPASSLAGFSKAAVENLTRGAINKKGYAKAAEALSVEVSVVATAVNTISQIFLESSRRNCSKTDFLVSIGTAGSLSDEAKGVMTSVYETNAKALRAELSKLDMTLPRYHNLDWRLDLQLATRARRNHVKPTFVLALETKTVQDESASSLMECDFANLQHVLQELEGALAESESKHCNRILRYVK